MCEQASLRGPTAASEPVKGSERVTALLPTQPHSPRGGGSGFSTGVQASLQGLTQGSQTRHHWPLELDDSVWGAPILCAGGCLAASLTAVYSVHVLPPVSCDNVP